MATWHSPLADASGWDRSVTSLCPLADASGWDGMAWHSPLADASGWDGAAEKLHLFRGFFVQFLLQSAP